MKRNCQPFPTRLRTAAGSSARRQPTLSPAPLDQPWDLDSEGSGAEQHSSSDSDEDLTFAPDTNTGIPNVRKGVDVAALLEQCPTFRIRKGDVRLKKLNGNDRRAYQPWKRVVCAKFTADLPAFLYHKDQIEYAMSQLPGDLLQSMLRWLTAAPQPVRFQSFLREIKRMLSISYLLCEARAALDTLRQRPNETVNRYFNRSLTALHESGISIQERINRFCGGLQPKTAPLSSQFAALRPLLP
ncbi:hypothetical protein KEM52_005004 [Ascosphaera acerosa]|nr:hypothetical protein KEM52_005004 [Ascosphaera acerosa]